MSDDAVRDGLAPRGGHSQPVQAPLALPLDYEALYLGHQEFFHAFAEIHLGSRRAAETVVHEVFLEILAGWEPLLQEGDLEQRTAPPCPCIAAHRQAAGVGAFADPVPLVVGPVDGGRGGDVDDVHRR